MLETCKEANVSQAPTPLHLSTHLYTEHPYFGSCTRQFTLNLQLAAKPEDTETLTSCLCFRTTTHVGSHSGPCIMYDQTCTIDPVPTPTPLVPPAIHCHSTPAEPSGPPGSNNIPAGSA
ncbi:hypothetical protein PCASD_07427 [Puccinia coronata f. sp. avenae]|uniref:Uncharacterized protein n=1 Tax=Puccinia coronata f. sp. avenae TaxID=200324 RepID=A0A2N5V981_9BASI|nr:hypothetical protein PCASD_07427 [Puccinia coronata f. sp. avenae]